MHDKEQRLAGQVVAPDARRNLDRALADLVTRAPAIRNAVVRVDVPDSGFEYAWATGQANADSAAPMTPDHQFHLASVAKTMTAVLVLQLWEAGALGPRGLDVTLAETELFAPEIVDRLHQIAGVSYGRHITVRHLLTHTSGIKNAAADDADRLATDADGPAPGSYGARLRRALADPARYAARLVIGKEWRMWDPQRVDDPEAGVLNWYLASGTAGAALWPPGQAFHYSDTAYVILGLLTEHLSGLDLHRQWRARIFDPLGLEHTYLAYARDPDPQPWIHAVSDFYLGDVPAVSGGVNVSFDRGGGGVVSTVRDVSTFLQALLRGDLFAYHATLEHMLAWRWVEGIKAPRAGVGLGVFAERTPQGTLAIGHSGAYGAKMYYETETRTFVCGTINQRLNVPYYWWTEMLASLHSARKSQ